MSPDILTQLCERESSIRARWERLLRLEPVTSALADPDALVYLIPQSLGTIFRDLAKRRHLHVTLESARAIALPSCECNRNPYLAYFIAGERALVEELVLLQTELPTAQQSHQDVADLIAVTRRRAAEEVENFCGVCTCRGTEPACRFYAQAR